MLCLNFRHFVFFFLSSLLINIRNMTSMSLQLRPIMTLMDDNKLIWRSKTGYNRFVQSFLLDVMRKKL